MKKIISIKVPEGLAHRLAAAAEESGRSKSEILREALEQYLAGTSGSEPPSFGAMARDVIGSAEGPEDLSTNPDYMEGYGK